MNRNLILVFEELNTLRMSELAEEGTTIVCSNDNIKSKVLAFGIPCRSFLDYSDGSKELQDALTWIINWPDMPIMDGRSFNELLVYNGVSIYWFLQTRLYLHRMKELLVLTGKIRKVIDEERPTSVRVIGSSDAEYIVSELQGKRGTDLRKNSNTGFQSHRGFPILKLLMLKLARGIFASKASNNIGTGGNILVVTERSNWRAEFDFDSQQYRWKDIFIQDIVKRLSTIGYNISAVDFENNPSRLLNSRSDNIQRQRALGIRINPWEKYINLNIIWKSRSAHRKLLSTWKQLQDSERFVQSMIYNGVSLYGLVRKDFEELFRSLKAFAASALIDAAERIIEIEKPQAILMHDEYGALQLSIINAARKRGIPTISIQHGLISDENIAYIHEPKQLNGPRPELLFPLPARMCVWSEGAKKRLIERGNFPLHIPTITGDPKLDYLPRALPTFDRDEIATKLRIPAGKAVILFATENLYWIEEKTLLASAVCQALKKIPECFLVVKLHPNEHDISFYHHIAEQEGLSELLVVKDVNLYELLYLCNAVILSFSTVGAEAMRMGKPVISLNLTHLHDAVPFIKDRYAIVVENSQELLKSVRLCVKGLDQSFIERAKQFAEFELGKLEGKAVERIVQELTNLIQETNITKASEPSSAMNKKL